MNIYLHMLAYFHHAAFKETEHTLLLVYSSFTPFPLLVWRIVLYSPSSSSLRS